MPRKAAFFSQKAQEEKAGDGGEAAESKTKRSPSFSQQTHAPPTPARTTVGVKTEGAASAVSAPSRMLGTRVREVSVRLLTYTPDFGT